MTYIAPYLPEPALPPALARRGILPAFLGLLVFTSFLPYPALALGPHTGLQISQALALVAIPFLLGHRPGRTLLASLALLTPLFTSAFLNALRSGVPEADVLPKEAVGGALALAVLWPAGWINSPSRFALALKVAAVATLAHTAIGLAQVHAFRNDEFPFLFLYRNPSFKSMAGWADLYARYMKRPCGLFPEPSALAASLGPWVVALAGVWLDPRPGAGLGLSRGGRWLFGAAVTSGLVLLAMARSGATPAVMAAVAVAGCAHLPGWARRSVPGAALTGLALLGVTGGIAGSLAMSVGTNLESRVESSWGLRGVSIVTGLTANTAPVDLVFGVGPGQSPAIVRRLTAWVPRPKEQDDLAVFSLAVCHYMENGLFGLAGLAAILLMTFVAIARSSTVALGLAALAVWLVGVTVTTSYLALSPIWLFLGLLLNWDRGFPGRPTAGGGLP